MPSSHTHRIRVRYAECDAQGHVFNAHYVAFFDIALTELWREAIGSYGAMLDDGVDLVVAEVVVRFRKPARFDEEIDLEVTVEHLGTTSMRTRNRVLRDGEVLVEGEMVHVFVDSENYAKTPIPHSIRAALSEPQPAGRSAG